LIGSVKEPKPASSSERKQYNPKTAGSVVKKVNNIIAENTGNDKGDVSTMVKIIDRIYMGGPT